MKIKKMIQVVVDVDTGVDDAWGLLLLLSSNNVDVLGITCAKGNTTIHNVCSNTLRVLTVAGRTEIPVYKGAENPLLQLEISLPPDYKSFHGENGFGDVDLPKIDMPHVQDENAVVALNRLVSEKPGKITLVCFAPLTNIALATRTYPDFVRNVKDVYIMGGNYTALGNTTMCAEFNFHSDPEAAHIVLTSFENKLTLLPWETCYNLKIPFPWRQEMFSSPPNEGLKLLTTVEAPVMKRAQKLGYQFWICCDQTLAAILVDQSIVEKKFDAHAIVELGGHHTRGQIVIDHLKTRRHNITIIQEINQEKLQQVILSLKNYM